jgi:nitrite reductase/ring-hydroxylating ferredoxin subunit/uncharacterized membrane protein
MGRLLARLMDAQNGWAKPFGEFNQRWIGAIVRPLTPIKDFLHGRWLGHPTHAAVTDLPIGALTVSIVLDLLGQSAAADIALVVGILGMLASAISGAADFTDTNGTAMTRASLHSTLMVVSLVLFLASLGIRAGNPADRAIPIALSIVAYVVLTAGAYVGGDVVYALGNMVDRHAFRGRGTKWVALDLGAASEIPEGKPVKAMAGHNTLVLVRSGDTINGLHEVCAHAGGPLSEGKLVDGCIECPWHGSRFRLTDGAARRGPTVYDQPAFEIRRAESGAGYEARRRPR